MNTEKNLVTNVIFSLEEFKKQLSSRGRSVCDPLIERLKTKLKQSDSDQNVITALTNTIHDIDKEGHSLEIEMNGLENYSDYEYSKIMDYSYKKELQNVLLKIIVKIRTHYTELNNLSN